jgi:hypothetical protein
MIEPSESSLDNPSLRHNSESFVLALDDLNFSLNHQPTTVTYSPKRLEQYSNQSDSEPLVLDGADRKKFALPLAKNYSSIQPRRAEYLRALIQ